MIIGIIGAMEEEIRSLKSMIEDAEVVSIEQIDFIKGKLMNQQVVLVESGIGKVNATIPVVLLKHIFQVTHIINTGTAGALDPALNVGDLILAHSLAYHDVDVTAFDYSYGQMAGMPEKYYPDTFLLRATQEACRDLEIEPFIGLLVSGDQFISDNLVKKQILENFPTARAVEMESTAIAQAAYRLNIPFVIIRAISDASDGEASMTFDQFVISAGKQSAQMVAHTISLLKTVD